MNFPNGAGGIPAYGLEPKSAYGRQVTPAADFHRGSAPLASLRSCHPDGLGELLPQTLSGSNPSPK